MTIPHLGPKFWCFLGESQQLSRNQRRVQFRELHKMFHKCSLSQWWKIGLWCCTYSRAVRLLLTRRDLARALAPLLLIWFSAKLCKEKERSGYCKSINLIASSSTLAPWSKPLSLTSIIRAWTQVEIRRAWNRLPGSGKLLCQER